MQVVVTGFSAMQRRPTVVHAAIRTSAAAAAPGVPAHRSSSAVPPFSGRRSNVAGVGTRALGSAEKWHSRSRDGNGAVSGLPMSLFAPFQRLPEDGKLVSQEQETCNPEERSCQTLMYVWESKCEPCSGTGQARAGKSRAGRRGRRGGARASSAALCVCLACHGLGVVRRTSSREEAVPLEDEALTLNRRRGSEQGGRAVGGPAGASGTGRGQGQTAGKGSGGAWLPSMGELKGRRQLKEQQQRKEQQGQEQQAPSDRSSTNGGVQPPRAANGSNGSQAAVSNGSLNGSRVERVNGNGNGSGTASNGQARGSRQPQEAGRP